MEKTVNRQKLYSVLFGAALLVYGGLLFYLYFKQLQAEPYVMGPFESDTAAHVYLAVEEHYYHSLAAFIYILLYSLPFSLYSTAFVLTVATVLSVVFSVKLLEKIAGGLEVKLSRGLAYILAFACNFHVAFYVSFVNRKHYIGYQCANMWHNSTYLFMRLFAILTVIVFLDLYKKYREDFRVKDWLSFTVLLMITTGFKASFLTVFAPLLAILLIKDLCKKTPFLKVFYMALSVIPSLAVMALQSMVLGGEGNGFAIAPFKALSMRGDHPKVAVIVSVLFPLMVLFCNLKNVFKEKVYFWTIVLWAVSFLEVFLLIETGERASDGNFMWGYSIALFFLFAVSLLMAVKSFVNNREKIICKVIFAVQMAVFLWHVVSGIWYFVLLLSGGTYFV